METMTTIQVVGKINQIMVDLFEVQPDELKPESDLHKDLGIDSLDSVDLVVSLEKEFGIRIDESQAKQLRTLGEIYDLVVQRKAL